MVETGLAERGALINPGSGFSMLLEAAEEKAGLPRLYDPPLTARTVFSDGTNSAARTAAATMPPPTKGLGCEMCRKESELGRHILDFVIVMTEAKWLTLQHGELGLLEKGCCVQDVERYGSHAGLILELMCKADLVQNSRQEARCLWSRL